MKRLNRAMNLVGLAALAGGVFVTACGSDDSNSSATGGTAGTTSAASGSTTATGSTTASSTSATGAATSSGGTSAASTGTGATSGGTTSASTLAECAEGVQNNGTCDLSTDTASCTTTGLGGPNSGVTLTCTCEEAQQGGGQGGSTGTEGEWNCEFTFTGVGGATSTNTGFGGNTSVNTSTAVRCADVATEENGGTVGSSTNTDGQACDGSAATCTTNGNNTCTCTNDVWDCPNA